MNRTIICGIAIVGATIVGCNKQDTLTPTASSQPPAQAPTQDTTVAPTGTSRPMGNLGMELAGPLTVSMGTDPNQLTAGKTTFTAEVLKNSQPVSDAKVSLDLYMPSMKMHGPKVDMKRGADGKYQATADVMSSDYEARVSVDSAAGKGTATFKFTVR